MKWIGILATITLIIACFNTWVFIESSFGMKEVTGMSAEVMKLGKPAVFHFVMAGFYLLFLFIHRIWAKRWNLLVVALNLAWAIRNFILISACAAGECPKKQWAIYAVLISSVLMLIAALFPNIEVTQNNSSNTKNDSTNPTS